MGRRFRAAAVIAGLGLVLAGCSGGSGESGDESASTAGGSSGGTDFAARAAAPAAAAADPAATRVVRTGQLTVRVRQLSSAATAVRGAATGLGGFVASESTGVEGAGEGGTGGESTLVLRVPEPKAEQLVTAILRTGELVSRQTGAEDVSAAVADVDSRVASQTRSLERVRTLLARATSINDVVTIEAELSKRETELEALQARQRTLNDQADLATITATLRLADAAAEATDLGFLPGLRNGWDAFTAALVVGLTVLGAVLPFAVPLALLATLAWYLLRLRRHHPRPAPTP